MAADEKRASGRKTKTDEEDEVSVSGIVQDGPDNAVAVKVSDLRALLKHARDTGGEEIADRFQL